MNIHAWLLSCVFNSYKSKNFQKYRSEQMNFQRGTTRSSSKLNKYYIYSISMACVTRAVYQFIATKYSKKLRLLHLTS